MRRPWLASAIVMLGCGRVSFDLLSHGGGDGGSGGDGGGDGGDAPADACTLGPWSAPVPVTAANSNFNEWAPALSPDGLTLMWSTDRGGNDLYMSTRTSTDEPFPAGTAVTHLNSGDTESSPFFTRDGRALYFTRSRVSVSEELFVAARDPVTGAIGAPAVVPELAGSPTPGPTLSADGNELLFGSPAIIRARRAPGGPFQIEGPVAELNTGSEGYPSLSADGRTIYFISNRDGPLGIFTASRSDPAGPFGPVVMVAEVAGGGPDDPEISADDRTLVFAADLAGNYDLWITTRTCL